MKKSYKRKKLLANFLPMLANMPSIMYVCVCHSLAHVSLSGQIKAW